MATVHDVARYMLMLRSMSAMKLQKLAYYSQAWHLVWHESKLFDEPIEAWANGPVVRELYDVHRGQFSLASWPRGDVDELGLEERGTVDVVLNTYGQKSAQWLSEETHREGPWRQARAGLPAGVRSAATITADSMYRFYTAQLRTGRGPEWAVTRP
jgi:uncharacterized phage-associated protein